MSRGFIATDYRITPSSVTFRTSNGAMQHVFSRCEALVRDNVRMFGDHKIIQEGAKYHGVWLETQPMGGEMYAKRDMEAALNNCLIFMQNQRRDGKMPGMIRCRLPWDGVSVHTGWMQGDFFTIPAMRMYYHIGRDEKYLKLLYTALRDFDDYLWSCRDSDGDGCLEVWCTWDTGDDNNTRYLMNRIHARENGCWNGDTAPYGVGGLPLESAEYMAYSYAQRMTLAKISGILGNGEADMWREKAEKVRSRFIEYLWDDERKFAFDRDCENKKIDCLSLANIKCMYQGIFTQEMADDFISKHLMNPSEFFTNMPLPNIAVNDHYFYLNAQENNLGDDVEIIHQYCAGDMDDNSWGGPSQGLCLQRSLDALMSYGHHAETALIGLKWIGNCARYDRFTQQYNPFTGEPAKSDDGYGPNVLGVLEYIAYLYGVAIEEERATWSALAGEDEFTYTQVMYGTEFTLKKSGDQATAFIDGEEKFSFTPGVRIKTALDGTPGKVFCMNAEPMDFSLIMDGKTVSTRIQPNEELELADGALVSVRKVPFCCPKG